MPQDVPPSQPAPAPPSTPRDSPSSSQPAPTQVNEPRPDVWGLPPALGPETWAGLAPPAPPAPPDPSNKPEPFDPPSPPPASHGAGWDPAPGPWTFRGCVTWALLLALVLALAAAQQRPQSPAPSDDQDPAKIASPILQFLGRYAIGWKRLLDTPTANDPNLLALSQRLDRLALHPTDDLRLAVLQGELLGRHEALARLAPLLSTPGVPDALQADARALLKLYQSGAAALTPEQAGDLVRRHRWFARLALVHDGPEASRSGVLRQADLVVRAMAFTAAATACATLAGLAILLRALARAHAGRFRWRYREPQHRAEGKPLAWVETGILLLAALAALQALQQRVTPGSPTASVLDAAVWCLLAVPLWPLLRGVPPRSWRLALGWHQGEGALREIGCGIVAYIAGLPVLLLGFLATLMLHAALGQTPLATGLALADAAPGAHPVIYELALASPAQAVALVLLMTAWAPLLEESVFRGALHHALRRRRGPLPAILLTAVGFAIIHPQGLVAAPLLTALAINLGVTREWRGSLIAPITLHALNNALVTGVLLLAIT